MSLTPSNMLPLETKAPDFTLLDVVSNKQITLSDVKSPVATVIMFICNHCPFVKHIQNRLIEVVNEYKKRNIRFIAICANDSAKYLDDSIEKMKNVAIEKHYPFFYLHDETQAVAKSYQAACTPDFYIFDRDLFCVYRGQFHDSRPGNTIVVTGQDICNALDAILSNHPVNANQKPSIGCNIKWQ